MNSFDKTLNEDHKAEVEIGWVREHISECPCKGLVHLVGEAIDPLVIALLLVLNHCWILKESLDTGQSLKCHSTMR